jgi:hypothetical protein
MPHRGYRWGKPLSEEKRRHGADVFLFAASVPTTLAIQFNHLVASRLRARTRAGNTLVHRGTNKELAI